MPTLADSGSDPAAVNLTDTRLQECSSLTPTRCLTAVVLCRRGEVLAHHRSLVSAHPPAAPPLGLPIPGHRQCCRPPHQQHRGKPRTWQRTGKTSTGGDAAAQSAAEDSWTQQHPEPRVPPSAPPGSRHAPTVRRDPAGPPPLLPAPPPHAWRLLGKEVPGADDELEDVLQGLEGAQEGLAGLPPARLLHVLCQHPNQLPAGWGHIRRARCFLTTRAWC